MEVKITFRGELYITGNSLKEIREKWEELPLFSADALEKNYVELIDVESAEDTETYRSVNI